MNRRNFLRTASVTSLQKPVTTISHTAANPVTSAVKGVAGVAKPITTYDTIVKDIKQNGNIRMGRRGVLNRMKQYGAKMAMLQPIKDTKRLASTGKKVASVAMDGLDPVDAATRPYKFGVIGRILKNFNAADYLTFAEFVRNKYD